MQELTFDYIIIGGGGAGAVLARRLADQTKASVALLEAGPNDEGFDAIHDLRRFHELDASSISRPVPVMLPETRLAKYTMPTSRVLGGSTSRNTSIWFRPPASDFADWEAKGAKGWGAVAVDARFDALESHVHIETQVPDSASHRLLWHAALAYGYEPVKFANPFGAGIGHYRMSKTGVIRQSSSIAYLHPENQRPKNLTVFTETEVKRLIIDDNKCVAGIETNRGIFKADTEVILSAGAIDTPKLLMLSGIGSAKDLTQHGITPIVDLPGVGRHLLDHPAACVNHESRLPLEQDPFWNYVGVLFATATETGAWPDIEIQLGTELYVKQTRAAGYPETPYGFTAYMSVNRARSEGSVRLASSDPASHPIVDTNYYSDPDGYDMGVMVESVKLVRRMFNVPVLDNWRGQELAPGDSRQSDEEIAAYLRDTTLTGYHPAGTCRMGAVDDVKTVVGPDLRVKGTSNLRVADASVMPSMVSVNIAATCMMIGHFAAEIITE
jgi:choline dehydrogenase-like flavoprotein